MPQLNSPKVATADISGNRPGSTRLRSQVLGFADLQGDNQKNLELSYRRAEAVVEILVTKCGVLNEVHAVPMGGTDLLGIRMVPRQE